MSSVFFFFFYWCSHLRHGDTLLARFKTHRSACIKGESLNSAVPSGELQVLDAVDILLMLLRLSDEIGSADGCIPFGSIASKPMPPKAVSGGDIRLVSIGGVGDIVVPPRHGKLSDGSSPFEIGLADVMSWRKTLSGSLPGWESLSESAPWNRNGS